MESQKFSAFEYRESDVNMVVVRRQASRFTSARDRFVFADVRPLPLYNQSDAESGLPNDMLILLS